MTYRSRRAANELQWWAAFFVRQWGPWCGVIRADEQDFFEYLCGLSIDLHLDRAIIR